MRPSAKLRRLAPGTPVDSDRFLTLIIAVLVATAAVCIVILLGGVALILLF